MLNKNNSSPYRLNTLASSLLAEIHSLSFIMTTSATFFITINKAKFICQVKLTKKEKKGTILFFLKRYNSIFIIDIMGTGRGFLFNFSEIG